MKVFKRKIYDRMLEWKKSSQGATALLLKGARRIGKSTIAEEFAKNEYESYIVIDFADTTKDIIDLFDYISNLDYFFLRLQSLCDKDLFHRRSVIIFDEVQLCPKARQAIKYLVKDGRYDYIETGSLLSIRKNIQGILIPSEEDQIEMFPMDFEEFLWACDKKRLFDMVRYCFDNKESAGDSVHRNLMREFRLYMLVGGMPQAVETYINQGNFSEVDKVKRRILNLYIEDFRKIDPNGRASTIFKSIPSALSRHTVRYRVGNVIENARPSRLEEIFADIADSMTVNFCYHASDPSVGMALHADFDSFKMYLADTGLFVTIVFADKDGTDNDIYNKLLSDKLPADLGYVYENVVAQLLRASGHNLYYYTFRRKENDVESSSIYEIDFLLANGGKISPIEVKSSGYKSHKSLDEFQLKYSSRVKNRYLLYTKDLRKDKDVYCLPVYMAGLF